MAELSNTLRQRLGAAQNGCQTHPDANLLTAFVEQALSGEERGQVLAHLSACRECREVVASSLPQLPETITQPVLRPAPVSGWRRFWSPAFGVAALITAMAVVAVVVMQAPGKSDRQTQASNTQAAPERDQASDQKKSPVAESMGAQPRETRRNEKDTDKLAANASGLAPKAGVPARPAASAGNQPVLTARVGKQDFVNTSIFEASPDYKALAANGVSVNGESVAVLPAAPQPQPSKSEARFTVSAPEIMSFSDIPAGQPASSSKVRAFTPGPPPEHLPWMLGVMQKGARRVRSLAPGSSPAISSGRIALSAMADQTKFSSDLEKQQPAEVAAAPVKPGVEGLERFDSLSHSSMFADENASAEAGAAWKVLGGKLVKSTKPSQWEEAYPGASFQFTFVSARGNEVWAGGTHASVLHSRDGGGSWEAPRLGDAASGSIVSILFSGANIQVRTSDDQSWSSSDGGKTWVQAGRN
jgi:putative zinc finger protein/photosynthesis system II assembly factor YCF48-like protein